VFFSIFPGIALSFFIDSFPLRGLRREIQHFPPSGVRPARPLATVYSNPTHNPPHNWLTDPFFPFLPLYLSMIPTLSFLRFFQVEPAIFVAFQAYCGVSFPTYVLDAIHGRD